MRILLSILLGIAFPSIAFAQNTDLTVTQQGANLLLKANPFSYVRSCIHGDGIYQEEKATSYEEALVFEDYYTQEHPQKTLTIKHVQLQNKGQAKDGPCKLDLLSYKSNTQTFSLPRIDPIVIGRWKIEFTKEKKDIFFDHHPVSSVE